MSAWYAGEDEIRFQPSAGPSEGDHVDHLPRTRVALHNASEEPVYEAVVWLVFIQGAAPMTGEDWARLEAASSYRVVLGVIPPGRWTVRFNGGWGGMHARPGAEVAFTDRAGRHWVRRSRGQLEELPHDALEYYGIERPVGYLVVEPPL